MTILSTSKYLMWREVDADHVRKHWHAVHWPIRDDQEDHVAYDWGDRYCEHAWCVHLHTVYFEDADEAAAFAILFGDAP